MGEFCSLPPITLKPRPSSVLGSSTTRGWEWPSLAAKAATVACWGDKCTKSTLVQRCSQKRTGSRPLKSAVETKTTARTTTRL